MSVLAVYVACCGQSVGAWSGGLEKKKWRNALTAKFSE